MNESIERMRKLVNDNLVMGLRFQMNGELNKLESEIEQELNSRAERTCECIMCAYFENKSTCGAYCNYFDRELGDDYDGGCTWGVLSGCKVVGE